MEYQLLRRDAGGSAGGHGSPEIFNTDQGSQFTSEAFTGAKARRHRDQHGWQGALGDNVFVERLWRSRSNTKRSICMPTTVSPRREHQSADTSSSTIANVRIRALTTPHLIKLTSTRCRSARQPNIGRRSTYQGGDSVQTTGATSHFGGKHLSIKVLPVEIPAVQLFPVVIITLKNRTPNPAAQLVIDCALEVAKPLVRQK